MTNILRSRRPKKKGFKIFIIILIIIFVLINYFKWQPFHSIILTASEPFFKFKDTALGPLNNSLAYFKSKKDLEIRNQELEEDLFDLKMESLSYDILKFEYESILDQKESKDEEVEIAKVVLKPPLSSFDSLILSGDFDDSEIGEMIFWKDIIIGEIVEITDETALVKLLSASGNTNPGRLKDGNQYEIIGRGGGQYQMILPKDVDVSEGDVIAYPEGEISLIGVVNKVLSTNDDLFNMVLFNIPVDFSDINYVRIGKPMSFVE